MRHILYSIATIAALASAASIATGCSSSDKAGAAANDSTATEIYRVEVKQVSEEEVPQISVYTATVQAYKTNNISSSTPNRIKQILVDVGSKVAAGQRLVVLDNANIDQLKINIDNVELQYNRAVQLLEIGAGTQQAVDQLKAQLDALKRQYANLVENTVLMAPVSGVVTARNYDPGDMTGGLPILTIEQVRPVKVIINVSESDYAKVKVGMPVKVTLDTYGEEVFNGTVNLIHPTVDPNTRTFTVEVNIPNADGRILPGMFARVTINYGEQMHVVVPDRAVVKQTGSGNKYIYVYYPGVDTVSYNKVELGQRIGDAYEVLSGVDNGAYVVIAGQSKLTDGSRVELVDKNKEN